MFFLKKKANADVATPLTTQGDAIFLNEDGQWARKLSTGEVVVISGGTDTTAGYQTNLTYAITDADNGENLFFNGGGSGAWTIPSGVTIGSSFGVYVENRSVTRQPMKITPASGTINGRSNLVLPFGTGAFIVSDGSPEYIATLSQNTTGVMILAKGNIPMVIPPSGSVDATGGANATITFSGGAAFNETLAEGCFMYLPAGGAYNASVAGWYYVVMNSTSSGTVYNNLWLASSLATPQTPAALNAITSGRGPTAYTTPLNSQLPMVRLNILGGTLGPYGRLQFHTVFTNSNSAQTKQIIADFGGYTFYQNSPTTVTFQPAVFGFVNQGKVDRQKAIHSDYGAGQTPATTTLNKGNVNTNNDLTLELRGLVATGGATDWLIMQNFRLELVP